MGLTLGPTKKSGRIELQERLMRKYLLVPELLRTVKFEEEAICLHSGTSKCLRQPWDAALCLRGQTRDRQTRNILYILSGTAIPNKAIADFNTLAVNVQICNRNCFFSAVSALLTECSA